MATFNGSNGGDVVNAMAAPVIMVGFSGGTAGELADLLGDFFLGGLGDDTIVSFTGVTGMGHFIHGGAGLDAMYGSNVADVFRFEGSSDVVSGETISGGGGNDILEIYSSGADAAGFFYLANLSSLEIVSFAQTSANSTITTQAWFNSSQLGAGLSATASVRPSDGSDGLFFLMNSPSINLSQLSFIGWDAAGNDTVQVLGGNAAETIIGSVVDDDLFGGGGTDYLDGGAGNDFMDGGGDRDTYRVDNTSDRISDSGSTTDVVSSDTISIDLNNYTGVEDAFILEGDINPNPDNLNLYGTAGKNVLTGNSFRNILDGRGGADELEGREGTDTYYVDSAGDVVREAVGSLNGTQDTVIASVNFRIDQMASANGVEHVVLTGTAGLTAVGHNGFNTLTGNSGGNYLSGLGGNDTINGKEGADRLIGNDGKDTLTGGAGDDQFIYTFIADSGGTQPRRDVISDFGQIVGNNDVIDLALTDANGTLAGNQAFTFIGTAAFTGAAGELRYFQDAANNRTIIEGNVRVDAASPGPELSIELTGLYTLTGGATNAFDIIL